MIKPKKNPVTKLVAAGVKAAAKAAGAKPSLKAAQKAKPLATPKSGVRVKPAAKPKAAPYNTEKATQNVANSNRRSWNPETGYEEGPLSAGKLRNARIRNSKNPSASGKASAPSRGALFARQRTVKINSAPKKK
jgi:hypothetical protein